MSPILVWDLIHNAVKELEYRNNFKLTTSAWDIFKDAERRIKERMESQSEIDRAMMIDMRNDRENLAVNLAKMENAVNRSVSGMKVDIGEWLELIGKAREILGERVIN